MITIEQYGAVTSSIFAAITLWLVWKTKTLTDVVNEMREQTKILNKSYLLQNELSLPDRIPYFKSLSFARNEQTKSGSITMQNIGTTARNVSMKDSDSENYKFDKSIVADILLQRGVCIFYFYSDLESDKFEFTFSIQFIDDLGIQYNQKFDVLKKFVSGHPPFVA